MTLTPTQVVALARWIAALWRRRKRAVVAVPGGPQTVEPLPERPTERE